MSTSSRISRRSALLDHQRLMFERDGRLDLGNGITLFRHPRSVFIHADIRLSADERRRESTRTTDLVMAETVALKRRRDLECRVAAGQPITVKGPSVGDLIDGYVTHLEARLVAGERKLQPELSVLRRNFLPFWRGVPLSEISRQRFYEWEAWREHQNADGAVVGAYERQGRSVESGRRLKPPGKSTLQREKQYLVSALAWASDQPRPLISDEIVHDIRHLPRRRKTTKKQRASEDRREAFSREQVSALLAEFERVEADERARVVKHGEKGRRRNYERRLMALHVRLLLLSGLRPGAEILELTWDRIRWARTERGETIIVIDPCGDGKTGPRTVNTDPEAVDVINDLKALLREFGFVTEGRATLWPSRRGGIVKDMGTSFSSTLKRLDFDERVRDEPLYICRHTYLTERLRRGVTSDVLAINCGTSHEMIDRHYNHLRAETIREALRPFDRDDPIGLRMKSHRREGQETLVLDPNGRLRISR